jgi:thiamine transport system permease protein
MTGAILLEIVRFTVMQALLSAGLCTALGFIIGRTLFWHTPAWLQHGFKMLGSLTFVTPSLVPSLAFLLLSPHLNVFGLKGIVAIHVFLNFAYVAQQIAEAYAQGLCQAHQQCADLLRLAWWQRLRLLEWPCVRDEMIHNSFLVFSLALASFTPILLLGGGPKSTTLSVALYQNLLIDFDHYNAWVIIILQLGLSFLGARAYQVFGNKNRWPSRSVRKVLKPASASLRGAILISLCLIILALPYAVLIKNTRFETAFNLPEVFLAIKTTLAFAVPTALLVTIIAVSAIYIIIYQGSNWLKTATDFLLGFPNIALISSAFILVSPWLDNPLVQPGIILTIAVICYAPYGLKSMVASTIGLEQTYQQQIQILRLGWLKTFHLIIWPTLGHKLVKVAAVVACFMVGNLTIPLLLGQQDVKTLSVLAYQTALRFETEQASGILLIQLMLMAILYGCLMRKHRKQR